MHISKHPHYDEFTQALNDLIKAHEILERELKKGDRGLIDAAKLDLKKAQKRYDEVSEKL